MSPIVARRMQGIRARMRRRIAAWLPCLTIAGIAIAGLGHAVGEVPAAWTAVAGLLAAVAATAAAMRMSGSAPSFVPWWSAVAIAAVPTVCGCWPPALMAMGWFLVAAVAIFGILLGWVAVRHDRDAAGGAIACAVVATLLGALLAGDHDPIGAADGIVSIAATVIAVGTVGLASEAGGDVADALTASATRDQVDAVMADVLTGRVGWQTVQRDCRTDTDDKILASCARIGAWVYRLPGFDPDHAPEPLRLRILAAVAAAA